MKMQKFDGGGLIAGERWMILVGGVMIMMGLVLAVFGGIGMFSNQTFADDAEQEEGLIVDNGEDGEDLAGDDSEVVLDSSMSLGAVLGLEGYGGGEDPAAQDPYAYNLLFNKNTTDVVTNMPEAIRQVTFEQTVTVTLPTVVPAREGYVFKGWGLTSTATAGEVVANEIEMNYRERTVTLYAVWEEVVVEDDTGDAEEESGLAVPDTGANTNDVAGGATMTVAAGVAVFVGMAFLMRGFKRPAVRFSKRQY